MKQRWLAEFIDIAFKRSSMSRDENTKVGAVIFSEEDLVEISSGYNCLARGVKHSKERSSRPLKYFYTSHAEASAISNAARLGRATKGASIVTTMFPCSCCSAQIINAGIVRLYTVQPDWNHDKYREDYKHSIKQLSEAEIDIFYIVGDNVKT